QHGANWVRALPLIFRDMEARSLEPEAEIARRARQASKRFLPRGGKLEGVQGLLEWRNWQTHGTQKPRKRRTQGNLPLPLVSLAPSWATQDEPRRPKNHYNAYPASENWTTPGCEGAK